VKTINTLLPRRKNSPDRWLEGSLNSALQLIEMMKARRPGETQVEERLVELEAGFQSSCETLLDGAAERERPPLYWEELFAAGAGIRRLFQLLLSYATLSRVMLTQRSFRPFLEVQGHFLENAREFFRECLANRKYGRELLRTNEHELRELRRLCLQGIASVGSEGQNAQQALRLLELFNELAAADAGFLDCLEKVYIATGV